MRSSSINLPSKAVVCLEGDITFIPSMYRSYCLALMCGIQIYLIDCGLLQKRLLLRLFSVDLRNMASGFGLSCPRPVLQFGNQSWGPGGPRAWFSCLQTRSGATSQTEGYIPITFTIAMLQSLSQSWIRGCTPCMGDGLLRYSEPVSTTIS